ncbi:MAG: hypothetical protein MR450_05690 [Prevotella sp.]|nr:hypothetical protein [Prevotella sp.]MDY4038632.1 hypothetical protein [Prevotella sp.]
MKRIFRFTYIALVAMLATMVSSCTNEYEYDPATATGEQVYFDQDQATTIEIDKTKGSFTIPLYRVNTEGTLTVPLQFTPDEGNIYTVPTEVTFQNGESSTSITITFDPEKTEYGTYVGGTLAIADAKHATPYGFSQLAFTAGATEWVNMMIDDKPATATYREDLVTVFFGVDNLVYQVPIQESKIRKGMYRLVNPYGVLYGYNEPGDYDPNTNHYLTVNATDPNFVYVEESPTSMDWHTYGTFTFSSLVALWLSNGKTIDEIKAARPDAFGKLENGVITMPTDAMLASMSKLKDGAWYNANNNGLFAIVLPGYVLADYTTTFDMIGRLTDTNDQDFVQGTVTLGPDAASAKVAIVAADADVEATAAGIIDGSVESQEVVATGNINLPFTDSGDYIVVIVVYGSDGKPVKTFSYPITLVSSKENVEQFEDIAAGVMRNGASDFSPLVSDDGSAWGYLGETFPLNSEAVLSRSKSDPTHYRLTPWLPFDGTKPLDFHWDEATGVLTVDNCPTGLQASDGSIYATDAMTFNSNYFGGKNVDSKYDAATNTLHFFLIYTGANYEGLYACEEEAFTISDEGGAKALKRVAAKAERTSTNGTTMRKGLRKHFVKVMKPLKESPVN